MMLSTDIPGLDSASAEPLALTPPGFGHDSADIQSQHAMTPRQDLVLSRLTKDNETVADGCGAGQNEEDESDAASETSCLSHAYLQARHTLSTMSESMIVESKEQEQDDVKAEEEPVLQASFAASPPTSPSSIESLLGDSSQHTPDLDIRPAAVSMSDVHVDALSSTPSAAVRSEGSSGVRTNIRDAESRTSCRLSLQITPDRMSEMIADTNNRLPVNSPVEAATTKSPASLLPPSELPSADVAEHEGSGGDKDQAEEHQSSIHGVKSTSADNDGAEQDQLASEVKPLSCSQHSGTVMQPAHQESLQHQQPTVETDDPLPVNSPVEAATTKSPASLLPPSELPSADVAEHEGSGGGKDQAEDNLGMRSIIKKRGRKHMEAEQSSDEAVYLSTDDDGAEPDPVAGNGETLSSQRRSGKMMKPTDLGARVSQKDTVSSFSSLPPGRFNIGAAKPLTVFIDGR